MSDSFCRICPKDREEWLEARRGFLCASDAAAILDISPWVSSSELFDEKTGHRPRKDISNSPSVRYGIDMEPLVREQAMIDLPYFYCEYHQFDILFSIEHPFMSATLDGELTVTRDNPWELPIGAKGVYEGKTGSFRNAMDLESWERYIPDYYLVQMVHQLIVTDWDFVIVASRMHRDGFKEEDMGFPEIRTYYRLVDRRNPQIQELMHELLYAEKEFQHCLEAGKRPARMLSI